MYIHIHIHVYIYIYIHKNIYIYSTIAITITISRYYSITTMCFFLSGGFIALATPRLVSLSCSCLGGPSLSDTIPYHTVSQ